MAGADTRLLLDPDGLMGHYTTCNSHIMVAVTADSSFDTPCMCCSKILEVLDRLVCPTALLFYDQSQHQEQKREQILRVTFCPFAASTYANTTPSRHASLAILLPSTSASSITQRPREERQQVKDS